MKNLPGTCRLQSVLHQQGLTLIELMIALALGLFIVFTAMGLLVASKAGYVMQDQQAQIQETGRYAIEILSRAVRQAGYENWHSAAMPTQVDATFSASVIGRDAMTLKKTTPALDSLTSANVVNGSDVLALRFFGDDVYGEEGAILNCAGLPVAATGAEQERGWSIFFVARDSAGEPELRCKYQSKTSWNADAIARGVESFQVLYGIDADGDGVAEQFLNADGINALDEQLLLSGDNALARTSDFNRRTHWKKVSVIKLGLLVRGSQVARDDVLRSEYDLFGAAYSDMHAVGDKGVRITESVLPGATKNRIRKVFTHTIQLRNAATGNGA